MILVLQRSTLSPCLWCGRSAQRILGRQPVTEDVRACAELDRLRPRKLLLQQDDDRVPATPAAPAPSVPCLSCNSPHTIVMVLAGMSCMMFLVSIALALLCWSVVKQRRRESAAQAGNPPSTLPQTASGQPLPVDSPEFDDAVLVQLPGDEKPQLFALPKPFHVDGECKEVENSKIFDIDDKPSPEKDVSPKPPDALPGADHHHL